MMSLEICLADEFLIALTDRTEEGILSLLVVCLLVCLEVVAATE
jgi:hypothetical protein